MGFIIWVGVLEPAGNLLWRPLQLELARNQLRQCPIARQFTELRPQSPVPGRLVGTTGSIAFRPAIAPNLPAYRRRCALEQRRDRPDRASLNHATRDLLTLGQGQRRIAAVPLAGAYPTRLTQNASYRWVVSIKQLGDLVNRVALAPALPHESPLAFGVANPRPSLHWQHPFR